MTIILCFDSDPGRGGEVRHGREARQGRGEKGGEGRQGRKGKGEVSLRVREV